MVKKYLTYDEYIENATVEQKMIIDKINKKNNLSTDVIEKIKNIKKSVNLLIFAESYCKDCAVILSFLTKMSEINKNIDIKILPRKGNEDILKEYSKEQKIPTIINLDNDEKNIFSEFPSIAKEEITNNANEKSNIISEFRNGKYNDYVQNEILQILI